VPTDPPEEQVAPRELEYIAPPDEFQGERVLLRSYRPGDGAELCAATVESFEHLRPWMAWATETQSEAEAERRARTNRGQWLLASDFVIAIRTPDDRRFLGGAGYHLREGPISTRSAEIGMWIRASEAGKGIGSAALEALLEWGFTEWPWRRLSWRCDAENAASRRIARKAGLAEEGVLRRHGRTPSGAVRDTVCYAILREEWLARRGAP
jgi:RimJ/RimL family protein N-acetyltransferase